jgi:hypothetical protein
MNTGADLKKVKIIFLKEYWEILRLKYRLTKLKYNKNRSKYE